MEFGLSHEMVRMIEERLGRPWADSALRGVALALILSPALIALTLLLLMVGLVAGAWAWAIEQADRTTIVIMVAALMPVALMFVTLDAVVRLLAKHRLRAAQLVVEDAQALVDRATKLHQQLDDLMVELNNRLSHQELENRELPRPD